MVTYEILPAAFPDDIKPITTLFKAYATALGVDLGFQDFETELNSLPEKYSPEQGGCLLVACLKPHNNVEEDHQLVGCVAYRALASASSSSSSPPSSPSSGAAGVTAAGAPLDQSARNQDQSMYCEMKRLYLTPTARGTGIGTRLVVAIVEHAKASNLYVGMRLDTLPRMQTARKLYEKYGFREVEKYYETPLEGTIFMELQF